MFPGDRQHESRPSARCQQVRLYRPVVPSAEAAGRVDDGFAVGGVELIRPEPTSPAPSALRAPTVTALTESAGAQKASPRARLRDGWRSPPSRGPPVQCGSPRYRGHGEVRWLPAETTTMTPYAALSQSRVRAHEERTPSNGEAGSPTERLTTTTDSGGR